MPPEYVDHGKISKKFDVFSLGVIIIEIMTGQKDRYPKLVDHVSEVIYPWDLDIGILTDIITWCNVWLLPVLFYFCRYMKTGGTN
jgi:serine/threonine protein kinase